MKVAIYARESVDDTERAPPIENQIEIGKSWIKETNNELFNIYADDGWSGGDWRRPKWNEIVALARARQFSIIWVWSRARIARDVEQFAWFYRNLKERGCRVYAQETHEFLEMESVGGYAKEISLAQSSTLFRLQTGQYVRNTYAFKNKEAKERGVKVVWGRKPVPEEIRNACIQMAKDKPELTVRQIAAALPQYEVINKAGVKKHGVSYGWVSKVLKQAGLSKGKPKKVKEYPSEKTEVKETENGGANQAATNSPIPEQESIVKETKG